MTARIGHEEWLAELMRAEGDSPEGFSMDEIAAKIDRSKKIANEKVKRWIAEGRMKPAGKRRAVGISGCPCWVPIYQVVRD